MQEPSINSNINMPERVDFEGEKNSVVVKEREQVSTQTIHDFEISDNMDNDSVREVEAVEDNIFRKFSNEHLKPNLGLVYLSMAFFFNSSMVVTTKLLETNPNKVKEDQIGPLQILLVRMVITYIGTLIFMYCNRTTIKHVPWGPPEVRWLLLLRGCVGFSGVFSMYYSLMYLTISDAVLITFLAPSVTIILASIFLHEKLTRYEVMGSITSLMGVILIIRPSFLFGSYNESAPTSAAETSNPQDRLVAILVSLVGVVGSSFVYIIIRHIGKRAHAVMNVSYFALVTSIVALVGTLTIPSAKFQLPDSVWEWIELIMIGICGFIFQILLTMGIQRERAGRGTLMQYAQIIYAIFWDVVIWGRWPLIWSWLGMFIVIGSTLFVIKSKNDQDKPPELQGQDLELSLQESSPTPKLEGIPK